jgi:RNA polymerase sigma-70 factor (ECF subfamily)
MSDELAAIVRRAQGGEAQAFSDLARRFGRGVYAIALAHLGRRTDAEDVAQTVLLAALERIHACRQPERFDAWLLAIARNRSRRALVRRRLRDVLVRPPEDVRDHQDPVDPGHRQRLVRALATLRPRLREVVLLHDLEGYTHREIARALDITEEASRQYLSRARKQIRDQLEEKAP